MMPIETLAPDAIISSTNLSGAVTDIDEPVYIANPVNFDGTNDWLSKTSAFTGAADGLSITIAYSINRTVQDVEHRILRGEPASSTTVRYQFNVLNTNVARFHALSSGGTTLLDLVSSATLASNTLYNVLFSCDLTDTGKRHLYINDTSALGTVTTYSGAANAHWAAPEIGVGASDTGTTKLNGDLADLWCDFNRYTDFSVEANRRKFFAADGKPVYKGADGSKPFGTVPTIFMSGPTDDWHTNKGAGGGFTENGALTDGTPL